MANNGPNAPRIDVNAPMTAVLTIEQLQAALAEANAKLAAASAPKAQGITFQVKDNGSLAIYGVGGRFPVQLHPDQWAVLFANVDTIKGLLETHAKDLVDVSEAIEISKRKKAEAINDGELSQKIARRDLQMRNGR